MVECNSIASTVMAKDSELALVIEMSVIPAYSIAFSCPALRIVLLFG